MDPRGAPTVYAPTSLPELSTIAHLTRQLEVKYADVPGGQFAAILQPRLKKSLLVAKGALRYPTVGSLVQTCKLASCGISNTPDGLSYLTGEMEALSGNDLMRQFNSVPVVVGGVERYAWKVDVDAGTAFSFTLTNNSNTNLKWGVRGNNGAGWGVLQALTAIGANTQQTYSNAAVASAYTAISIEITAANNASIPADTTSHFTGKFTGYMTFTGAIPASATDNSIFELVDQDILDQGDVTRYFCTAASMLTTSMADLDHCGGQITTARIRRSVLAKVATVSDLFKTITDLSDPRQSYNGRLVDGGYSWYFPDDLSSYSSTEKIGLESIEDDSVLVVAGTMAEGGSVRIQADWVLQFYTPKQVFQKVYSPVLTDEYRIAMAALALQPAACANDWHNKIIELGKKALSRTFKYIKENPDQVAKAAEMMASMLL